MGPFKTVILFVFLSFLGVMVIPSLPVDLRPSKTVPVLTISYALQGATPEIVERLATSPLENMLSQLTQIKNIYSISSYHQGSIQITFNPKTNIDFKKFEVASVIRQVYPKLNGALSYPIIEHRSHEAEAKRVLLAYRINAKLAPYQLKKTATDIFKTDLSRIRGVKEVQVSGGENIQLTIDYDLKKLDQFKVTPQVLVQSLSEAFQTSFPGYFKTGSGQRFSLKVENSLEDIQQLLSLKIKSDSSYVPLKDLAQIYREESQPRDYFRINGDNSVAVSIYADESINRIALANTIKGEVNRLSRNLPDGYSLVPEYDDTEYLVKEINKNLMRSALAVLILLLFITITYRKWKHLVMLASSIAINLLIALLLLRLLGVSIHLYTLAGLTISFGLLVDNAIVMLDHVNRNCKSKISTAILGASLTTILSLLLVLLLPEEDQQNLVEFCIAVAVTISVSIGVAIFFVPAFYALQLGKPNYEIQKRSIKSLRMRVVWLLKYIRLITFLGQYKKTVVFALVLMFGLPVFLLPPNWEGQNWYNQSIGSDAYQERIRTYTDKLLGGALRLFVRHVNERSGYRTLEKTRLYVDAKLPHGHTLENMDQLLRKVELYLKTVTGIDKYITHVASGERGSIEIMFEQSYEDGNLPHQLKVRLIAQSLDLSGAEWNIYGVGRGFSNSTAENVPNFKVEMRGYNYHELENQADVLASELLAHKRIQKVNTNERLNWNEKSVDELTLQIDKFSLGMHGITPQQVATSLRQNTQSNYPAFWMPYQNDLVPVFIEPAGGEQFSTYHLMNNQLHAGDKDLRIANVAQLATQRTANAIHKENRQYIRQVGFDYYGSSQFGEKYLNETLATFTPQLPAGYTAKKISWSFSWNKTKRQYGLLLLLVAGIFVLNTILFDSFILPWHIILSIPVSFIGLFLSFGWFEFYFDQGGYAAFILLGGLVVNSAIFIVNDLVQLKRKTNQTVLKTVTYKLKPILLTVLSTCLGLLPFLIGGQREVFWFALAVGTIGGLFISTLYTTFLLPIFIIKMK